MPKAQTAVTRDSAPFKHNVNSLKRNQACHQCRKRKLKCDAKRPCSTCLRSHAYALSHAPPNERAALPQKPECTYDEVSVDAPPEQAPPAPKTRYEKLESRINELESLLKEKATSSSPSSPSPPSDSSTRPSGTADDSPLTPNDSFGIFPSMSTAQTMPSSETRIATDWADVFLNEQSSPGQQFSQIPNMNSLENLAGLAVMMEHSPPQSGNIADVSTPSLDGPKDKPRSPLSNSDSGYSAPSPLSDAEQSLLFLSWPANLPDPLMTKHLVQAFFSHWIHASRMFHASSFFSSLNLHPSDPGFPRPAVLHAMCAIGSIFTSQFPSGHIIEKYPYDPVARRKRDDSSRISSFASQQARFAKEAIEEDLECGESLFENSQARTMLTWFSFCQAKWIDNCLSSAMAMRSVVTMALNSCPPFHGLTAVQTSSAPPSVLPPAKTIIEDEMRRNNFWIAYTLDRQSGAGHAWAMNIDDKDVSQLFPLRQDQWEQGVMVLPHDRQYAHARDALSSYPLDQTDPFIMYCKASLLMSKVKNFCLRYRSMQFSGDPSVRLPEGAPEIPSSHPNPEVIRRVPAFVELNQMIQIMKASFPTSMKSAMKDGKLNLYTYGAWNIVHMAQIHLHEPFAIPGYQSCTSACAILTASRAIVDLLHTVTSTSYDVSLVDTWPYLCWYMAGRVLVRFLKSAQDQNLHDQLIPLRAEIAFLRGTLMKAGERVPLAYCYYKMLVAVITQTGVEMLDGGAMHVPVATTREFAQQYQFMEGVNKSASLSPFRFTEGVQKSAVSPSLSAS